MSKIEVNQISSQCGSTLTIGQSGDTVTLACGATQTGFGRTGTVDWCTTAKTAPFTGVSGKGYFVNTTCGAVTVTLPATPTAGDIISIADYASTFQTNNVTIFVEIVLKLMEHVANSSLLLQNGQSITLVYVDGTRGWKNTRWIQLLMLQELQIIL
jgi:acetylornithine/succinyldiaminopimelate/putrescine aminotransferase